MVRKIVQPLILWLLAAIWILQTNNRWFSALASPRVTLGLVFLSVIIFVGYQLFDRFRQPICTNLYKYRYLIVAMLVIVGVCFELTGSSIGIWGDYLNTADKDQVWLGVSRIVRSDEFGANTPLLFSQMTNPIQQFPYYSEVVRATSTDMYIVYGQPVLDLAVLFRPTHWGYLVLGLEKGFSFFWLSRIAILSLAMFELFMRLLKQNKILALSGSLLITFGPVTQWWFAVNGLVEMITIGAVAVIVIDEYLKTNKYVKRFILASIFAWCAIVYILVFYPAWQVPVGYVYLVIAIYFIMNHWKKAQWNWRKDPLLLMFSVFLIGAGLAYVLFKSQSTLQAVLNTVYPGNRTANGGGDFFGFITDYPIAPWYTFTGLLWERGMDVYFDFFPIGLVLGTYLWLKKKDRLAAGFVLLNLFFFIYIFAGFPTVLSKATLMSFTTSVRTISIFGIANIILLLRAMAVMKFHMTKRTRVIIVTLATLVIITLAFQSNEVYIAETIAQYGEGLAARLQKWSLIFLTTGGFASALYCIFSNQHRRFLAHVFVIVFLAGVMVNPVRSGVAVIYESDVVKTIQSINQEEKGIWLVDSLDYPMINVPIMAGAATLNSTSVYPNLKLWQKLDPAGQYEEVYNRYAHISLDLVPDGEVEFELVHPDVFLIKMPVTQLKALSLRYVMTDRDLASLSNEEITFELIEQYEAIRLYRIVY